MERPFNIASFLETDLNSSSIAIGNDVVYLPNFEKSFNNLFKKKVYTINEIEYCDTFDKSILRYASTWAAKEACYKAIKQLNNRPIGWKNIEILRDKVGGKPSLELHQSLSNYQSSLTISHDGDYVWAIIFLKLLT